MTSLGRSLPWTVFATTLCACQAESEVHSRPQAVIGGVASDKQEVLHILSSGGGGYQRRCSSTLVAPNLLLTARHCVSLFTDGQYSCTDDGTLDQSRPQVPAEAGSMGLLYSRDTIDVYSLDDIDELYPVASAAQLIAPPTDTICRNDLAFVVLDRDLDLPIRPIRLDRVVPNEELTVVGYGTNDTGYVGLFERELTIIAIGESEYHAGRGASLPRTFAVGQGPCPGDSGGPAISNETGEVLGVYSLVIGACDDKAPFNVFTHVGSFESVVRDAFEAAGHSELLDAGSGSGGSDGAGLGGQAGDGGSADGGSAGTSGGCALGARPAPGLGWVACALGLLGLAVGRRQISKHRPSQHRPI